MSKLRSRRDTTRLVPETFMNTALGFLFWRLCGRGFIQWLRGLRHPGRLLGFVTSLAGLCMLFQYRNAEFVKELVASTPLGLVVVLAIFVSLIRGLMQKGIPFDPPDMEYLCCGPFSERAVLLYRLLPAYLSASFTGFLVYFLLGNGFQQPLLTSCCVVLAHLLSIHLTTRVSLFAGSLPESTLKGFRKGIWLIGFVVVYLILRPEVGNDGGALPDRSNLRTLIAETGLFFTMDPSVLVKGVLKGPAENPLLLSALLIPNSSFLLFGLVLFLGSLVWWSFSLLMAPQLALYEPSLRGQGVNEVNARFSHDNEVSRHPLNLGGRVLEWLVVRRCFNGAMSIVWKNLLCARRSVPSLLVALAYTLVVVIPWLMLVLVMRQAGSFDDWAVNGAIPLTLAALPLLLQTALPFDFRLDGRTYSELKGLPFSSLQTVASVIAVPTLLCVGFQIIGLLLLLPVTPFSKGTLVAMLLGFPVVALGVNAVWNLYYVLFSIQRHSAVGKPVKRSTFGALFVLGLAFGVFFPSCWLLHQVVVEHGVQGSLGALVSVLTQIVIDGVLLWGLARAFSRMREVQEGNAA